MLDLSDNEVRVLENFARAHRLKCIFLNNNRVSKIEEGLERNIPNITTLILTNNKFVNLTDLDPLASLPKLEMLSLAGNSVTARPHYRMYLIHTIPQLKVLDYQKIKPKVLTVRHDYLPLSSYLINPCNLALLFLQEREEAKLLFKSMTGKQIVQADAKESGRTMVPGQTATKTAQEQLSDKQIQQIKVRPLHAFPLGCLAMVVTNATYHSAQFISWQLRTRKLRRRLTAWSSS